MSAISYEWLDESQKIMRVDYRRNYTWDDYHNNIDAIAELMKGDESPLYVINVYEHGAHLPQSIVSPHWKRTARTLKIGYVVYQTTDAVLIHLLRNFLHTISYKEGKNYTFAPTMDEALAIIQQQIKA